MLPACVAKLLNLYVWERRHADKISSILFCAMTNLKAEACNTLCCVHAAFLDATLPCKHKNM